RGFTECLREEMEVEGANVGVTCVHPGGIKTNIARASRVRTDASWGITDADQAGKNFEKMARTTPEAAARGIRDASPHDRRRQIIGRDAGLIDFMQRMLPESYQRLLVFGAKRRFRAAR